MYAIESDNSITLPRGDTLAVDFEIYSGEEPAEFPPGTVALFGVCDSRGNNVLRKEAELQGSGFTVNFTNRDTRDIRAGEYQWDVRIVTDPERDAQGNVICNDDTDDVVSAFSGADDMPVFRITEVAVNV